MFGNSNEINKIIIQLQKTNGDRFSEIGYVGEGKSAWVLKGRDKQWNRCVAIKILKSKKKMVDIINEGFMVAKCNHSNIVQVYDTIEYSKNEIALIMEFIEGDNLKTILNQVYGSIETAIKIALDICDALIHTHQLPIVHRDIKPGNILIYSDKKNIKKDIIAKLTDFGIAIHVDIRNPAIIGSLAYMTPEQIDGKPQDIRWDIYSLIVVLYEMLQQKRPFEADSTTDLIKKIQTESPEPLNNNIPKSLQRIIYKGLNKDINKRYQSALELKNDLEIFKYCYTKIIKASEKLYSFIYKKGKSRRKEILLNLSKLYGDLSLSFLNYINDTEAIIEEESPVIELYKTLLAAFTDDLDNIERIVRKICSINQNNSKKTCTQKHPVDLQDFTKAEKKVELTKRSENDHQRNYQDYKSDIEEIKQLLNAGMYESAREKATAILTKNKSSAIHYKLCKLFYEENIIDFIITYAEAGIKINRNHAGLYSLLGKALFEVKQYREAKAMIEKARELGARDKELDDLMIIINNC